MELVSYVSQDNFLFNLSVRENIRIGKPDATDAEVEDAARKASCHDFILSLPKGYDTLVGDHDQGLSRHELSDGRLYRGLVLRIGECGQDPRDRSGPRRRRRDA